MKFMIRLLGALLFFSSFSIGYAIPTAPEISAEDVQRFSNAVHQIKRFYVEEVDDEDLFDDAIRGMLQGLDPHSAYLDEQEYRDLKIATQGQFGGLGIEVTMENGAIKVISPIDNTPASNAGLQPGDYIVRLDEVPVKGMTLRDAINRMRGEIGTSIHLTVFREGESGPLNIEVVRDVIKLQSISSRMLEPGYGYVRISQFQADTAKDAREAVAALQEQAGGRLQGLVLDLRNNPGGLLDTAVKVSDIFIHNDEIGDEELIVYTEGRIPGTNYNIVANPGDLLNGAPIVALINEGSASGSEIVAGALQDNDRAILVGTRSFGKGSVQTVVPLDENHGIKITTALYYTPSGDSIQAEGVVPDITVEPLTVNERTDAATIVTEADLIGHLANQDDLVGAAEDSGQLVLETDLAYDDYQLNAALNVLKGLVLVRD